MSSTVPSSSSDGSLDFSSLSSSHFVVLGGTGNVGSGVVARALAFGALVVIVSRSVEKFTQLKSALEKHSIGTAKLKSVVGDFRSESEAAEVAKNCAQECNGRVDHVVSNLGFGKLAQGGPTAPTSTLKDVLINFEEGLYNTYHAVKAFIPLLREQQSEAFFSIVQAPSQHTVVMPNLWAASLKQHAVHGLMLALAKENENTKVRVNSVCVHLAVAAIGQTKNQWNYDATDTRELAPVFLALAAKQTKRGQTICVETSTLKDVAQKILLGD